MPDGREEPAMQADEGAIIAIVAALILNGDGKILLVRKKGTERFMQPGGKREPGEDDLTALSRELSEEIGCAIVEDSAEFLGTYEAPAAHEPGRIVRAAMYRVAATGNIACRAEIAELIWLDPEKPGSTPLAALTQDVALPLALGRRPPQAL